MRRIFERLGIERPPAPNADALHRLHRAHLLAVPFENLSIHLGETIALDRDSVLDKLLARRRGGFCYELNGGLALLLEALGYQVERVGARAYGRAEIGPPFDHLALLVRSDDGTGTWLIDVGFGRDTPPPLRFDVREEQVVDGGRYQLADVPDGDVDLLIAGEPAYRIERRSRDSRGLRADLVVAADRPRIALHPEHDLLPAHRHRPDLDQRPHPHRDQRRHPHRDPLDSDEELLAAYRDHFDVALDRVPDGARPQLGRLSRRRTSQPRLRGFGRHLQCSGTEDVAQSAGLKPRERWVRRPG